jgi:hypothetical protein
MKESFRAWTWGYIPTDKSMGTVFDKALYRGYTDATFKERTDQPSWQGYMGPTLRGEVGDMIEVSEMNFHSHPAQNKISIAMLCC